MSSKRPRLEAPLSSVETTPTPPLYGNKEYWEERYQKQFQEVEEANEVLDEESTDEKSPAEDGSSESTLPYHSWYYTYEELRPLLLPLVMGRLDKSHSFLMDEVANDSSDEADDDELVCKDCTVGKDDNDDTGKESTLLVNETDLILSDEVKEKQSKAVIETSDEGKSTEDPVDDDKSDEGQGDVEDANSGDEEDSIEDVDESDSDSEDALERDGLASNGPITILEIGCGDVPLGAGLALDLKAIEDTNGVAGSSVVTKITCTDYSRVVVDMMQKQHGVKPSTVPTESTSDRSDVAGSDKTNPLEFVVADARNLPYADNSYTLVLEKGTLDAMLSDTSHGVADCIQIVAECARVTSACFVLISHLNAITIDGQRWLEQVVMGGLKRHSECDDRSPNTVAWEIEVHGNSQGEDTDDDDDDESKDNKGEESSSGPAVYIIHKKTGTTGGDKGAVSVKFFSY